MQSRLCQTDGFPPRKKFVFSKFKKLTPMTQGGEGWLLADFMVLH